LVISTTPRELAEFNAADRGEASVRAVASRVRSIRVFLLVYGVAAACAGGFVLTTGHSRAPQLQTARIEAVQGSINVLNHGGPPLVRSAGGQPVSSEAGDDPGMILYLSLLGHALGNADPLQLLQWLFIGCFAMLLLVYPLLWYELLSSVAAGIVSPLLIITQFGFVAIHDIYWVPAWGLLLGIPLLVLVHQRWNSTSLALLTGVMLIASFVSSIRAQAGLPLLIGALIIVFVQTKSWPTRLAFFFTIAIAYVSIIGFALPSIRHYRDASVGANLTREYPTTHAFWHPAYLGLGYLPNDSGIRWNDSIGLEAAKQKDPTVRYLSPRYERDLRSLYFQFVRNHLRFTTRLYLAKSAVVVSDAFRRFWLAALILPPMLLVPTRLRRLMRTFALLLVPAVVLGVIPALLGVPVLEYEYEWLAAWGIAWMLGVLWLVALVPWGSIARRTKRWFEAAAESVEVRSPLPVRQAQTEFAVTSKSAASFLGHSPGVRWSLGIAIVVVAIGLSMGRVATAVRAESATQFNTPTKLVHAPVAHGEIMRTWRLASTPSRWAVRPGVTAKPHSEAIDVTTGRRNLAYELVSPPFTLDPGDYLVVVRGEVRRGGLALGVVDVSGAQRFVVENLYAADQQRLPTNFINGRMVARFSLASTTRLELTLSNWAANSRSRWHLQRVSVVRKKVPCGCSPTDANAWISH